jgi:hypothetical protein
MRQIIRSLFFTPLIFILVLVSPVLARSQAQNPTLGLITKSTEGFIGNASAPDGAEAPGNGAAQGASHHADPSAASAHASPHRHSGDFGRSE